MSRNRISPKTKERFRTSIRNVIDGLSRNVVINKQSIKHECPNCYYDKLTGRSTGKCRWTNSEAVEEQATWELSHPGDIKFKYFIVGRCPICLGAGYTEIKRRAYASCLVIWNPESRYSNSMTFTPAGTEGSTMVQLKTDPKHYNAFKNADSLIVDGVNCKIATPPALRGLGNQSVLIISAFTTEKPKLDSGEIIKDY
jgi:predicted nucleic-acid-binding Zn-ribbon protein